MIEWTEQEEQEMIALAKAGDPRANYELSQWALERSEEEPDEIRWSQLAAKCLLKSAQAGYGPAQQKMERLLKTSSSESAKPQTSAPEKPASKTIHFPASTPAGAATEKSRHVVTTANRPSVKPIRLHSTREEDLEDEDEEDSDLEEEEKGPARERRKIQFTPFSKWGEAQWRKMEMICIGICAVLIVAIVVIFLTSRHSGSKTVQQPNSAVPAAEQITTATAVPDLGPYPDDSVKEAIQASEIEIQPAELDYVQSATSATIVVGEGNSTLRLRTGPNTNYREIASMPNGETVDVYANKDDWALVRYQSEEGPVYGWCRSTYLLITTGGVG